ncbi:GPW/gp25 family protein [bacterium SCSIO 12741]|nr:GPW/gp25 family protein [bacterium SCSIO 12741]
MENEDKSFLGTGWNFPPRFQKSTSSVEMVSYDQDIRQSLHVLLGTEPGERVMMPRFGCSLREMLFENIDTSLVQVIGDRIRYSVLHYEPRITLDSIEIDINEQLNGVVYIHLNYTIRRTNTRSNMVYPFYLREATNKTEDYQIELS